MVDDLTRTFAIVPLTVYLIFPVSLFKNCVLENLCHLCYCAYTSILREFKKSTFSCISLYVMSLLMLSIIKNVFLN